MARLLILLAVAVVAAGCGSGGGSGEKTFDEDGFGITFRYPDSFDKADDIRVGSTAGAGSKDRAAVGLDEHNIILVTRFDLRRQVTPQNVDDIKGELDGVVSRVAGEELSGKRVTYGELPGYEYGFDISDPAAGHSRFVALFDGDREYTINCQATAEKNTAVEEACNTALSTLGRKS